MFVSKKKYNELEKRYNELFDLSSIPPIEKIEIMKNNIEIQFGSTNEALVAWSQILTKALLDAGAANYIELVLGSGKDQYVCTVRKFFGKTPDQLKREAEKKVKLLEEEIRVLKGE